MSGKKKAALTALVLVILGALTFGMASSAAVSANGTHVLTSTTVTDLGNGAKGIDTVQSNGPEIKLRVGLVESSVNTKTYAPDGVHGCGNVSMSYNRPTTSSPTYTLEKLSSWNAAGNCVSNSSNGVNSALDDLDLVSNSGVHLHHGPLGDGATYAWFPLTSGSSTSRACWDYQDTTSQSNSHNAIGLLAPGGAGYWQKDPSFSC